MTARASIAENHDWYIGDDFPFRYIVLDENEDPVDVSGWEVRWSLREHAGDPDILITKTVGDGISLIAGSGYVDVDVYDTDTDGMEPGTYVCSLKRTDTDVEETLAEGTAVLKRAATS
jgi:hypothetical protein